MIPFAGGRVGKPLTSETSKFPRHGFRVVQSLSDGRVLAATSSGHTLLFAANNGAVLPKEWSLIATRETFQDSNPIGFLELPTGDILASIAFRGLYRFDGTVWKDPQRDGLPGPPMPTLGSCH